MEVDATPSSASHEDFNPRFLSQVSYLYLVVDVIFSWFSRKRWKDSLASLYLDLASSFSSFSVWTL